MTEKKLYALETLPKWVRVYLAVLRVVVKISGVRMDRARLVAFVERHKIIKIVDHVEMEA